MSRGMRRTVVAAVAVTVALVCATLTHSSRRYFLDPHAEGVLGVLRIGPEGGEPTAEFTTTTTIDTFHITVQAPRHRHYDLRLTGASTLLKMHRSGVFACTVGRNVPLATYRLTVSAVPGPGDVEVHISDRPVGMTGWQLLSRGFIGLLVLAALARLWTMRRGSQRQRIVSKLLFRHVATAVLFITLYLALHEGGHAVAAMAFGRFSLERSDFFGVHGSPHAGVRPGVELAGWQRAIESIAGPMTPILAGWLLFLWWRSRRGSAYRAAHTGVDFATSALIAGFTISAIIFPGFALGFLSDGDWRGFAENVPTLLRQFLPWIAFALSAIVLYRTAPHMWNLWRKV